jgi:predicted ATPase with chaperone activity
LAQPMSPKRHAQHRANLIGLPNTAVQEARKRVRAAVRNSGCGFPLRRITVNLAPADLKKEGPALPVPQLLAGRSVPWRMILSAARSPIDKPRIS